DTRFAQFKLEGEAMTEEEYEDFLKQQGDRFHRTLVQYLIDNRHPEAAAAIIDGGVSMYYRGSEAEPCYIDIPPTAYALVADDEDLQSVLRRGLRSVTYGHLKDVRGDDLEDISIAFRMKTLEVEEGWKEIARDLIVQYKGSNQGLISETLAKR